MSLFTKRILGIDIHDYSVELVEIRQKGKEMYLEAYNRALLETDVVKNGEIKKPEELKKVLIELIKNANPKAVETRNTAVIFPSSKVLTHIFTFPANLDENEIKKSIAYEAETIIPFSINDVYWDFMVIEKEDVSKKHASQYVFFACVNKQIADEYTAVLESIGLNPLLSGINAEALKYAMWEQMNKDETNLILDIETLSVNYLVVKNQKIQYFFSSNEGGKKLLSKLSKELQSPEKIILNKKEQREFKSMSNTDELKKFIGKNYKRGKAIIEELAEKATSIKVQNIILTGEFLNLPGFYEVAKTYFPDQKILIGDPKTNLKIEQGKFIPMETRSKSEIPYSTHFANAIGIALRAVNGKDESGGINLLPGRLKESITNKKKSLIIAAAVILMTGISLFTATFLFFMHQNLMYDRLKLEIEKSTIENMIYGTRYQQIHEEITALNKEINELNDINNTLFSMPITLEEILKLVPEGVEVKSMDFIDEELTVSITGIAKTRAKLLEIQGNFENAEFIEEVIAPISNFDEELQISFVIKIKLNFIKLAKYDSGADI